MPRPGRIAVERGVYHVYNRVGRGEGVFAEEALATVFVDLLREVAARDELTVFAWCLLSNHFHLAVRTGVVPLDRSLRSLQQRVTRAFNLRNRVFGPLWQGRYRAKLVDSQRYLDQLLVYIHLNPVSAGIVDDPAQYRWSGHCEILGRNTTGIVDVDEILRVFGSSRRSARAAYVRRLKGATGEEWIGESPGHLPWWRLGRPPKSEDEDPERAVRERRRREEQGPEWRPRIEPGEFVTQGAARLGVDLGDLRSRLRRRELVRARELLMVVGVERYRLKVKDLARSLCMSPDGASKALARGTSRRTSDNAFREDLGALDRALSKGAGASDLSRSAGDDADG